MPRTDPLGVLHPFVCLQDGLDEVQQNSPGLGFRRKSIIPTQDPEVLGQLAGYHPHGLGIVADAELDGGAADRDIEGMDTAVAEGRGGGRDWTDDREGGKATMEGSGPESLAINKG